VSEKMKNIPVSGCIEGVCPYFKRTQHYDYSDELTCTHPQIKTGYEEDHMHEYEYQVDDEELWERSREIGYKILPANCGEVGVFPMWCKLEGK
jgi:hypothetical protein